MLAERVIEAIAEPFQLDSHQVTSGVSIGITLAPTDGTDADQLLKAGDMALHRAKSDGRGIYRFFESDMDAAMQARRTLAPTCAGPSRTSNLSCTISRSSTFRPVITGFEALLRWRHPTRGVVGPLNSSRWPRKAG